jgi:hypothetical protein
MHRSPLVVWCAVVVLCAAWAWTAGAQYSKPIENTTPSQPSDPPSISDPGYFERQREYADKWWDNQQKQQQPSWWRSGHGDPDDPTAELLTTWLIVLFVAIMAICLLWAGARFVLRRLSGPTDPMTLAMNDPWLRERLAKSGPRPNGP